MANESMDESVSVSVFNSCENCVMGIRDFCALLSDKSAYQNFLVEHGVIRDSIICQRCHSPVKLNFKTMTFKCLKQFRKKRCGFKMSARKFTWFDGSRLSIESIGYFTVLWCIIPYPRQVLLQRELECAPKTIVEWSSYCREVCSNWAITNSQRLGGDGRVVEIHEFTFDGKKYKDSKGEWIFGGIERDSSNKFFIIPVRRRHSEILLQIIKKWILPGTTIISDCFKVYDCLQEEGFIHLKVNSKLEFVDTERSEFHLQNIQRMGNSPLPIHTQHIKNLWKNVKEKIPRVGRKRDPFASYVAEFTFKKFHDLKLLPHAFFKQAAILYPPPH